jgi:hypothetical protein
MRIFINRRGYAEGEANEDDNQKREDDEEFFHDVR